MHVPCVCRAELPLSAETAYIHSRDGSWRRRRLSLLNVSKMNTRTLTPALASAVSRSQHQRTGAPTSSSHARTPTAVLSQEYPAHPADNERGGVHVVGAAEGTRRSFRQGIGASAPPKRNMPPCITTSTTVHATQSSPESP